MNYIIRRMEEHEYPELENFLYEAIYQRDANNLLPREIINDSTLQVYIKDFGTMPSDQCLCAEVEGRIAGAVWVRTIDGFGKRDNGTPEFAISLYREYRGYGIGTALMEQMIALLRNKGYKKASLAVQKDNYALKMYLNTGFRIINESEEEFIMIYDMD